MNVKFLDLDVDTAFYVINALTKQKDGFADEVEPLRAEVLDLRAEKEALKQQVRHLKRRLRQYEQLRLS